MSRFDMLTILLKAVGVYCGVSGLAHFVQVLWWLHTTNPTFNVTKPETLIALGQPAVFIVAGLFLAVEGRLVARMLGEWPRPT